MKWSGRKAALEATGRHLTIWQCQRCGHQVKLPADERGPVCRGCEDTWGRAYVMRPVRRAR